MRKLVVVALCATIGACSSDSGSFWRSPSAIKTSLHSLEGQPLDNAIRRLGLPQAEQQIAGRRIFVWSDRGTVSGLQARPLISSTAGQVDWYAVSSSTDHYCVIRAVTDENEIITHLEIKATSVYYCPGNRT